MQGSGDFSNISHVKLVKLAKKWSKQNNELCEICFNYQKSNSGAINGIQRKLNLTG